MRLLAISDLHLSHPENRAALHDIPDHGGDWLIIAGDVAERLEYQDMALHLLAQRFAKLIWVPGNHDLWSVPRAGEPRLRGAARYRRLIEMARSHDALTPEDPYLEWPRPNRQTGRYCIIAPLFLLYDYSFRPASVARAKVRQWARAGQSDCSDEVWLRPDPFATREDWCDARIRDAERRLMMLPEDRDTVLVNHWPLRADLIRIPRIPRFTPWCGSVRTADWHGRFRARAVVTGHLHTRRTDIIDGCRFEEVSLGYPQQWHQQSGILHYFREILGDEQPARRASSRLQPHIHDNGIVLA